MTAPRVVGLDLSLTATGIADSDGSVGTIKTKLRGCERLAWIAEQVANAIDSAADSWVGGAWPLVVIEDYAFSRADAHSHQVGELGGVIRLQLHEAEVPWVAVVPSSLKKYATGKGNANKAAMLQAAWQRLGYEGTDDNEADALWLRAMGLDALGHPLVALPAVNRAALEKVAWPERAVVS